MTEFDNLKRSYASTIQCGLAMGSGYQEARHGNDLLHKFCEMLVDSSNCSPSEKQAMKKELEALKEALSREIDTFFQSGQQ